MPRAKTKECASPGSRSANVNFSYELFELAHMLRVRPRAPPQVQDSAINKSRPASTCHLPFIQMAGWHEDEYGCLLILLCSNGTLLVWSVDPEGAPVTKQISWFQNPCRAIKAFALDPSGSWLVCACMDSHLYIVPVAAAVRGEGRQILLNFPWRSDDITKILCTDKRGQPCSVVWWHTIDDFQMCIVGTELGEVIFVDLCTSNAILSVDLKESITVLEIMQDKQHQSTSVMIGTVSGETWQLVLESKSLPHRRFSTDQLTSPSVASALGYEMIGMMAIPLESFQAVTEWQDRLRPMPVKSAIGEVQFSVQHARNQVFIGVHNQRTDILQVYDTDIEHLPMFIYQLPSGTSGLILTDRLIFTVVHADQGKTLLCILSSQLAETSLSVPPPQQQKAESSVIETFTLPADEQVVGLFKRTKTMEGLGDSSGDEGPGLPNRTYTVDGCVLVTTGGVYECRPRVSPEKLFLDLAINSTDNTAADMLAITTGLDVNMLYQMAAEESLRRAKYEQAMKLYQLSKCPFNKRVAYFAKHGHVGDILTYLRQALSKHSDFHTAERKQLSNLTLYCFVQQVLECSSEIHREQELTEAFSQFINDNFDYDECGALELLGSYGLKEHMFDVAKARGLMPETLEILYQTGQLHLSSDLLNKLASRGFTDVVSRSYNGAFLHCMDPKDTVSFLLAKPETILSHLKFLMNQLVAVDEESLVHIARVLDPSRPSFRSLVAKLKTLPKRRTMSGSSVASLISLDSTISLTMDDVRNPGLADLLHLFLCSILVLNHKREKKLEPSERLGIIKCICGSSSSPIDTHGRKREDTVDMLCQRVRLSCGQQHTAVVSASGDVYTWGRSQKGRLGHGDLIEEEGKSIPFRVEILHMHRIKVLSVACGIEHTLALCRDGVYAWGSSEYGQLGQGDTQQHTRPVFITELSDKKYIAVTCGHYHSLALSTGQQVWAWGWGVHGQLGLGSIEDALLPSHMTALDTVQVTQLAAGYSHTAVLNTEGQVFTFGGGLYGQLGLGTTTKRSLPQLVEALQKEYVYLICCGSFETVAVTSEQKVYNFGRSPHYFRFHMRQEFRAKRSMQGPSSSSVLSHRLLPVQMDCSFSSPIKEIHCGNWHYLAVTESRQVYTWGFNDHGQLGHSTKMEHQLSPKVMQMLNDRIITTASVGAEFSVVMDTMGHVWVWGRADSGQLGLDVELIGSGKKEVPVPTLLSSLPALNRTEICTSSESLHSEPSFDVDWKLPDLSLLGNKGVMYGRESLTLALGRLYQHYSAKVMLRHCLDIGDFLSTSVIYDNMNQWSEALGLRLKFLNSQYHQPGFTENTNALLEHAVETVHYSLRKFTDEGNTPDEVLSDNHLRRLLSEVLDFWVEQRLPQPSLESLLNDHLIKVAYPLSFLIVRDQGLQENVEDHHQRNKMENLGTQHSKLQFSAGFLNSILDLVAQQIHSEEKGREYKDDLAQSRDSTEQVTADTLTEHVQFGVGSLEDVPTTQDHLIQEIVENMKKDMDKCSFITLSVPTAATVAAAAVSQQRDWKHDSAALQHTDSTAPDVIAFTCNHQFPRIYFMELILPEFQQRMTELLVPLVQTTKTLLVQYKTTDTQLLAACPVCVYNSLRAEQLERVSDANAVITEGFKAKPWEI